LISINTCQGPSLLRRGGAAAYAARAGWFARSADSRARRAAAIMGADDVMDEDVDLWESVVHDDVAMESLVAASAVGDHSRSAESSRQRFLDAVRAFSQANREVSSAGSAAPVADANELLRVATVNASRYEPRWVADPATTLMGSRSRSGSNGIEVGDAPERRQSLAHLPMNAGEGRAIRAEEAFPRDNGSSSSNPFASFRMASELLASGMSSGDVMRTDNFEAAAQADEESTRRPVYGFRVAFDHPATGDVTGASMGGCYLVGVTTTSFSAYGEQNGLQQSPFFWGIEDGGQKYEGSRHSSGRRRGGAIYAVEIGANEAPMNAHGFLFGAREVITCVCDLESRTLTFWRDETLLGTLVSDLPRNVNLYPVAVPFNCGVTVAITGLSNDPLPL
jgi:SPRY domain